MLSALDVCSRNSTADLLLSDYYQFGFVEVCSCFYASFISLNDLTQISDEFCLLPEARMGGSRIFFCNWTAWQRMPALSGDRG